MKVHIYLNRGFTQRALGCAGLWAVLVSYGFRQTAESFLLASSQPSASIAGTVVDPSEAVVSGASVALASGNRDILQTSTDVKGEFCFDAVPSGHYALRVEYPGFKTQQTRLNVGKRAPSAVRVVLAIADLQESVNVDSGDGRVSTEPGENIDVVRITSNDLENLPMRDRDYLGVLSELLDPVSTGSGGATIIVDGLPSDDHNIPLSEIEEIRINKNPYSAEFARPGKGRIEIITKSGSSKYHGSLYLGFRDYRLDARNAFAILRQPERRRQFEGYLSGPVHKGKKNTFSLTASHSQDDPQTSIYALGPSGPIRENANQGQTTDYFTAQYTRRVDKNSLSFRYSDYNWARTNQGIGVFVLPEAGFDSKVRYHQLFSSYRAVINPTLLNEFFVRVRTEDSITRSRLSGVPKVVVLDAFTGGGAQADARGTDNRFEFTDVLSWSLGRHVLKTGINIPSFSRLGSNDLSNANGTFTFSSLEDYLNNRPFSFLKQSGDGHVVYWQKEVSGFVQDEMRLRHNLSVVLGLRYDWQNYLKDYKNLGPRLSFAFAPGKSQKTVLRGGAGVFYDMMGAAVIGDILRLNDSRFRQILLTDPNYPNPFSGVPSFTHTPFNIARFGPTLRSPYTFQYSFGVERQLRKSLTLTGTYVATRGVDLFRSRDVNAPGPPSYLARPDPALGVFRQIESSGGLKSRALETTLRGNMTRFFTGMAVYRFGRAMNDTDGIGSFPANNWNPRGEWSRASFDSRHFVYLYGTLNVGKLFKFGAIFSANSGRPYSMTTGLDDNNDGVANDRPPGVPRNSLQGTGTATLNLRWSREFPLLSGIKEGLGLVANVDAFNLFNRVNYTTFVGDLSSPFFGDPVAAAAARRLQLSLVLKF